MTDNDDALPNPARPRLSRKLFALIAGGAAALIAVGAATWALRPHAEANPYPEIPEGVFQAADVRFFDDLATMTATSALVVKGTAVEIRPGAAIALDDGSGATVTDREVVLEVDEVLYDRFGIEAPETVVVVEGYWEDGVGYTREGMPWIQVGQTGYFYLAAPHPALGEDDAYTYIHETGRVLIASTAEVSIPGHWKEEGPWVSADLADGGAPAFTTVIESAADAANAGEAIPETVTVCEPSDPADENSTPVCWEQ